jgi:hypothetical protein
MRTLLLCLIPFMAAALQAQTATPYDCQQSATFTASTLTTASYYNRGPAAPCVSWRLTYHTQSATGVSISLQGTGNLANGQPDPAGWTNLTVTAPVTNPATGTAAGTIAACCDYYPWIRVTAGTFTGAGQTMSLTLLGYKGTSAARTTGGGGGGTVTAVTATSPIQATSGNAPVISLPFPATTADIATPANPTAGRTSWYTKGGKWCSLSPAGAENCTGGGGSLTPPVTFTDITTPADPTAGNTSWYTKGGKLCSLDPSGNENCTGGGSGGGGPTTQTATANTPDGTVYQNTGTTPRYVNFSWRCQAGTGDSYGMTNSTNSLVNPTNIVSLAQSASILFWAQNSFIVLPGWYYSITTENCTPNVTQFWIEWN